MFKRWMASAALVACCVGCISRKPAGDPATQAQGKRVEKKLEFGGSCSTGTQCASGACVVGTSGARICSKECRGDGDCGAGYRCDQMFPSEHGSLCVAMK